MEINNTIQTQENEFYLPSVRTAAIKILSRFERSDAYIDKLLEREFLNEHFNQLDKALLTEIVNGVIRWKWKLDWVLTGFYIGDYLKCLNIVKNAMRVALYQILFLDKVPEYAAINESVESIKKIQGEKIAGIVNGVLRNISRNIANIRFPARNDDIVYYFSIIYSHPRWMVKKWIDRYGEADTEKLLQANNKRPEVIIKVNTLKAKTEDIIREFQQRNFNFTVSPYLKDSISLKSPGMDISSLDSFKKGMFIFQDTSASLATRLASPKKGNHVIDLCSAPGGKTFCMAELMGDEGTIYAYDKYPSKVNAINEEIKRFDYHSISPMVADALLLETDNKADVVFADVPCSGLGTISKKPDIKWKREFNDIASLNITQKSILSNAAYMVKEGGALIYSTCTIEPEENMNVVNWFLHRHIEFSLDNAEKYLPAEVCKDGCMQTFPHIHGIDGAFAARFIKNSASIL